MNFFDSAIDIVAGAMGGTGTGTEKVASGISNVLGNLATGVGNGLIQNHVNDNNNNAAMDRQQAGQTGGLLDGVLDLFDGGHDGGVVAAAKGVADFRQAQAQHFPAQIHGDLPGNGHVMAAAGALDVVHRNAVVRRNRVLNDVAGDASALAVIEQLPQGFPGQLHVDGPPGQRAVRR